MAEITHAHQGDTLSAICWRHYGRTDGVVERVLEANPGLAAAGFVLPHGARITLPEIPASVASTTPLIQLWT